METAAFFDLDKTVIAKSTMVAFGPTLMRAGLVSRRLMVRGAWTQFLFERFGADQAKMDKYRHTALRITQGWDQRQITQLVAEGLMEVIAPIVYDEALALIRHHQQAGHRVFIVSASPHEIVGPLAEHLGVDEAIASRARIDEDGRYTGELDFYSYGPFKAEAMVTVASRHGIDLSKSYAYSDSATDLPMLEAVGHPTAVNPDRELERVAMARQWPVLRFDHPVPLRSRVPLPERRTGAMAAGAAVVMAAGASLWWRQRRSGQSATRPAGFRSPAAS